MIQAILSGKKTQTRRIINPQPIYDEMFIGNHKIKTRNGFEGISNHNGYVSCPYGFVGDVLWVKETFFAYGHWVKDTFNKTKTGKDSWEFVDFTLRENDGKHRYFANNPDMNKSTESNREDIGWHKRPSIFMPKIASRITLEITDIRVERLQDISEEDAKAEGVESPMPSHEWKELPCGNLFSDGFGNVWKGYKHDFQKLWLKINGEESWNQNPWVWVIEFKKV